MRLLVLISLSVFALTGCSKGDQDSWSYVPKAAREMEGKNAAKHAADKDPARDVVIVAEKAAGADDKPAMPLQRKVIRTAEIKLIVQDFEEASNQLKDLLKSLVEAHGGYVSQREIGGSAGSPRSGHWVLRVPVDDFEKFLDAIVKLGIPERNSIDTRDVTDQFYDLEAELKNRKREEEETRRLLDEKKLISRIEDLKTIREELNKVRRDIDLLQGRRDRMANQIELTTVTLTIQEIKNYVPPQTPTFGATVGNTFSGSIDVLAATGRAIVLVVVALAPWLIALAVISVPAWLVVRSLRQPHRRAAAVEVVETQPPAPDSSSPAP